ncbi:phage tail protein [Vibrio metschnikovii]|nr:phage tail protein [Vibrio metschnikovii]
MHHLVIGEFVFSMGDKTPISKMERVSNGAYSEVSVIDGSKSEFTGRPFDTIDIAAKWTRYGAAKNAASLRDLLLEPQQVSDGQGFNLGKWTIKQIKEGRSELVHDGRAMVTEVNLQLMEFR